MECSNSNHVQYVFPDISSLMIGVSEFFNGNTIINNHQRDLIIIQSQLEDSTGISRLLNRPILRPWRPPQRWLRWRPNRFQRPFKRVASSQEWDDDETWYLYSWYLLDTYLIILWILNDSDRWDETSNWNFCGWPTASAWIVAKLGPNAMPHQTWIGSWRCSPFKRVWCVLLKLSKSVLSILVIHLSNIEITCFPPIYSKLIQSRPNLSMGYACGVPLHNT